MCPLVCMMVWLSSRAPVGTKQVNHGQFTTSGSTSLVAGNIVPCCLGTDMCQTVRSGQSGLQHGGRTEEVGMDVQGG